tara:strand:- start:1917 stop:2567 length:651 start_codon:yes stop_codon:yes gene_type:complete
MSHNKIKVAGQNPDSSGNISLSSLTLGDLSNVTINSPSNDQIIKYDASSSSYVNGVAPAGTVEYILLGQGESSAYSNSNASGMGLNDTLEIYDTSPLNTITGASLSTSATDWYDELTLPAGKYHIMAVANVEFSASGYIALGLMDSTTPKSAQMVIGDNASSFAGGSVTSISSYFELSGNTVLNFEIRAVSNVDTVANQGNTVSEFTSILITKLAT